MENKLTRAFVWNLLKSGKSNTEVFQQLVTSDNGAKLAKLIAMYPDPKCSSKNKVHIWILVTLMLLSGFWAIYVVLALSHELGMGNIPMGFKTFLVVFVIAFTALLMWAFWRSWYGAYAFCIVMPFCVAIQSLPSVGVAGAFTVLLINSPLIIYVWYVKTKIFPHCGLFSARVTDDGRYTFLDASYQKPEM